MMHAKILCLNFIKYYSSWLYVSATLLDDYFIIRKHNELNHRDRGQIALKLRQKHNTIFYYEFGVSYQTISHLDRV